MSEEGGSNGTETTKAPETPATDEGGTVPKAPKALIEQLQILAARMKTEGRDQSIWSGEIDAIIAAWQEPAEGGAP